MTTMEMNWDPEVVDRFIKPESQQKDPEVFRETHVPINKIRAEILRPHDGQSEFVSETEFRDAVLKSELRDDNRIFIVKGEVGSGKSHLCQWLEYEINGYGDVSEQSDSHVAIHISRSDTKLDEILEILHEPLEKEYDEVGTIGDLDPEAVADFIIQGLRTFHKDRGQLKAFDLESFVEDFTAKTSFREVLIDNLSEYQSAVEQEEKEQMIELFSREDYREICFSAFGNAKYQTETYPALRRAVHDLLTNNLGIENFKGQLEDLSDAYVDEGIRPVLICEDLTTFNVLKDDLLDHIFDLSSSHFDIVLGWTSGWERENIDDALSTSDDSLSYMTQRSQGYLSMTDDHGRAYFLEDKSAILLLVSKYLDAIKAYSAVESHIPEQEFDGLYPFNEAFIQYVYQNLIHDGNRQQTPRVLLVHVIADCLTSEFPPYDKVEMNAFVNSASRPDVVPLDESEDCQRIAKWYGKQDPETQKIWVSKAIFDSFDVDFETGAESDGIVFFEPDAMLSDTALLTAPINGKTVQNKVSLSTKSESDSGDDTETEGQGESDGEDGAGESDSGDTSTGTGSETEGDRQKIPPEKVSQFQTWIKTGSNYPSSNTLRSGVELVLNRWHDPTRLANENSTASSTSGIYFARGSEIPVEIKGPDQPSSRSFTIDHGIEKYDLYSELLYAGVHGDFNDDTNMDTLRGWATDEIISYRREMRTEIEEVLDNILSIEEFVVLAKFLIMNGGMGVSEITRDILFTDYKKQETSPLHKDAKVDVELPMGMMDAFNDVTRKSSDIDGLMKGFFLLKKNVVDYDRLATAIEGVSENLETYIQELAYVSVDELPGAYKIGTTRNSANTELKTLIRAISDFANELIKLQENTSLAPIEDEIQSYVAVYNSHHSTQDLLEIYTQFEESLQPLGITKRGEWEAVGDLLRDDDTSLDLDAFGETLDSYQSIDVDNPIDTMAILHGYQQAKANQTAWRVYDVLIEMDVELDGASGIDKTNFEAQLRESDEFTNFSKQRDEILELLGGR